MEKPNVFTYHNYRDYLKDWFAFRKTSQSNFSMRQFSEQCGLAAGLMPMILNEHRNLTPDVLKKMSERLDLNSSELSFLKSLVTLMDSTNQQERLGALRRMQKFSEYQQKSKKELEVFKYLTKWYYVAVREMAFQPDFKLDPKWIQGRLLKKLPLKEIKDAIDFLLKNEFILSDDKGRVTVPEKQISCFGGIFRLSLTQFHKQVFALAADSIESVPRTERTLLGHTFSISQETFEGVNNILTEALEKIRTLELADQKKNRLYHVGFAAFPITKRKEQVDA